MIDWLVLATDSWWKSVEEQGRETQELGQQVAGLQR